MIYVCKNDKLNKFLEKYILDFIKENVYKIIGIDFEFNTKGKDRKIALCQINFEKNNDTSDIFLFYPPFINKNIFIQLLTAPNIIKILHGAESLDIPYLFNNIIDEKNRNNFCNNLYDTRYLCEYYNISNLIDGKCKIYDLLLQMNVIDRHEYDELYKNDKLIGNIWEINIDVTNLIDENIIKYCVYDVKYLPQLFRKFPKNYIFMNIIPKLTCINFITRYNKKINDMFSNVSKYNLFKNNTYNMKYSDIYINIFYILMSNEIIYNLYSINYFKKIIEIIIKNILYSNLNNNKLFELNLNKKLFDIFYIDIIKNI